MMTRLLVRRLMLGSAAMLLPLAAGAEEEKSLLRNGGFGEVTQVAGVAKDGGKHGSWTLKRGPHAPAHWKLSGHFGGELTVLSDGAPEGKRFLRIQAGDERQAHILQLCPEVKSAGYYRASIQYRGGPVLIKAYEYGGKGGSPLIETMATGNPTDLDGEWSRIECFYYPLGAAKVAIVAAVAEGRVADIDDFRLWQVQSEEAPLASDAASLAGGWLNVKDFGASGSKFETMAETTPGSNAVVLNDAGDFEAGQWVSVSKCNVRYDRASLYGPKSPYRGRVPLGDAVEIRGYDGSQGSWFIYILEIESADPHTFRWSDDLVLGFKWQATRVAVTWDWQKLSNGIEVKFNKRDLQPGHMIAFDARDQLVTKIEKVEGNKLILCDKANRSVKRATVRHNDSMALQTAIAVAIKQKRNVLVPNGHYRLTEGIDVRHANIRIEGESGVSTVMDITEGRGAIFGLRRGEEVTIRNFRMIGHTNLAERPGSFKTSSGYRYWACALKSCQAVKIYATERVLVENVHASRMSSEAFYCQGPSRSGKNVPHAYTKSLTFLRCSATDCAANAFNNNDTSENTCVLYCRIDGVGWYAYEGPGKFVKCIGNYVRNSGGGFVIGNYEARSEHLHQLGCGQAVIRGNVLEGTFTTRTGVDVTRGARQVTIANNLFVNFNGTAIRAADTQVHTGYPARNIVITGNIVDMTHNGEIPRARTGIEVYSSDVSVANNQIYVRGSVDPRVSGIWIKDPAVNITVHDNLVRNCAYGIRTSRVRARVEEVIDPVTFLQKGLPMGWRTSHRYRGWGLAWTTGDKASGMSILDSYDPESMRFRLTKPRDIKVGDGFEVFPPHSANWNIHDNTITGCAQPVVLDSYGSNTSLFRNNIITRGTAKDVKQAVQVSGRFNLIGNHICGFDEKDSAALTLSPYPAGRTYRNLVLRNIFERCSTVVKEAGKGLWDGTMKSGNVFINCGDVPDSTSAGSAEQKITPVAIAPPKKPELRAPRLKAPTTIDGDVSEWPWKDNARVAILERGPMGDPISSPKGYACAAYDDGNFYLAMRFELPKRAKIKAHAGFDRGDGIEVSFQNADPKHATPIFLLWGSAGGRHEGSTAMGASAEQAEALRKATVYAAKRTPAGWTCEWRIPFGAMGLKAANAKTLLLNMGLSCTANGAWAVWAPTGGRVCDVDLAGELRLVP